jgi:ATP-dependent DNA helicase RecG
VTQEELEELVDELAEFSEETEWIEFKENQAEPDQIGENISAISNSAALLGKTRGYIVWGIQDISHEIVGTRFRPATKKKGNDLLEPWLINKLHPAPDFRFHTGEVHGKKVVVLEIPPAERVPVRFATDEYIRISSSTRKLRDYPEKARQLWQVLGRTAFETGIALERVPNEGVLQHFRFEPYFDLTGQPIPESRDGIISRFVDERFIVPTLGQRYNITNLGAITFGRDIHQFGLGRKVVRVIQYKGIDRVKTVRETTGKNGYGTSFERLIDFVNSILPKNEHIERALRVTNALYPEIAIRELIANALVHQDFSLTGTGPTVEIFSDRVEITNPGVPLIKTDRFVDAPPQSRNEALASLMRRLGFCEERGSGIDKVLDMVEAYQLPAPEFLVTDSHTRVVLYAPKPLSSLGKDERVRACYWHAALLYATGGRTLTNSSVRGRFKLTKDQQYIATRIITDAVAAGAIKPFDPDSNSRKQAKYVPYWV